MRSVQRSDNGEAGRTGETRFSTRKTGTAGSAATGDIQGNNVTCAGATIWAADSLNAGMEALRWQQGATGADPCGWPVPWLILVQCGQLDMVAEVAVAEVARLQSASPSAGARSTARNSPEAMSLRSCIASLYTEGPTEIQGLVQAHQEDAAFTHLDVAGNSLRQSTVIVLHQQAQPIARGTGKVLQPCLAIAGG